MNNMQIVIVNGAPRSGKDTFCQIAQQLLGESRCTTLSTVDRMKEVAFLLGWNGQKDPKTRKFLSDLKDISSEWNDIPFQDVKRRAEAFAASGLRGIIFVMSREPEEIERFCKELDAIAILIRRDEVDNLEQSNHADAHVFNYAYNEVIYNNGTFLDLERQVRDFIERRGIYDYKHDPILDR